MTPHARGSGGRYRIGKTPAQGQGSTETCPVADEQMPGVVLSLVLETVDTIVEREFCRPPDQAFLALAGSPAVGSFVVADPWRSWPVDVVKRRPLRSTSQLTVAGRTVTRVRPRRLARTHPTDLPGVARTFRHYSELVGRLAGYTRDRRATLVTYDPFVAAHAEAAWVDRCIYVGQDDFAAAPRKRAWWPAYREAYRRIADRCDAVFSVSDELSERIAAGRAITLPNGIDAERWAPGKLPARRAERPYAVYAGSVEGRIDTDLFHQVLKVVPEVLVAGPCVDPEVGSALERIPGVVLLGTLRQDELVSVVTGASVGLIPHRDTPMTRAMSPLKLYEYLAAGLPVVATDLPPVAEGGDRVWRCKDSSEWADAVSGALKAGRLDDAGRRAVIDHISWSARLEPLVAAATR